MTTTTAPLTLACITCGEGAEHPNHSGRDSHAYDVPRPARRHDLYTMSAERIAAKVIGRRIRVTTWARGTEYGTVESVEGGRTVVRLADGTWTYGPSGRITVH